MRYLLFCLVAYVNPVTVLCFPIEGGAADGVIAVTTCCNEGESFVLGLGKCQAKLGGDPVLPVRPVDRHKELIKRVPLKVNVERVDCPPGRVVKTSLNFTYYGNESLQVGRHESLLGPGEFCLNSVQLDDETNEWAAVYCVDDPCVNTTCVKKCCPRGMSMNVSRCQTSDIEFDVTFRNEAGNQVRVDNYVIRDEAAPECENGMLLLNNDLNTRDEFYVLPDGRVYEPDVVDGLTSSYCVDHFLFDDVTVMFDAAV